MTSAIVACRDRQANLCRAMASWLLRDEISEVLVVDFSSQTPLRTYRPFVELCKSRHGGKVRLCTVVGESDWHLSVAYNLAARLVRPSCQQLLKLDCDYVLSADFFERNKIEPGRSFLTGNWAVARDENETKTNGLLYVGREDFFRAGGYNEYIRSYGWDDTDLYRRLESQGLARQDSALGSVAHIPHDPQADKRRQFASLHYNRFLAAHAPWSVRESMSGFDVRPEKTNLRAKRTCTKPVPEKAAQRAAADLENYLIVVKGMAEKVVAPSVQFPEEESESQEDHGCWVCKCKRRPAKPRPNSTAKSCPVPRWLGWK